jgi:hypothetical protein
MGRIRKYKQVATVADKLHLMRSVLPLAFKAWVDSLKDGDVIRRVRGHSFDDAFAVAEKDRRALFTVILRKPFTRYEIEYWEMGLTTYGGNETLHVWIQLTPEVAEGVFKENSDIFE